MWMYSCNIRTQMGSLAVPGLFVAKATMQCKHFSTRQSRGVLRCILGALAIPAGLLVPKRHCPQDSSLVADPEEF